MAGTSTLFHARAAGLAGRINGKPFDVIAPSTLANFGGKSSSTVGSVDLDTLKCGQVSTNATMQYNPATKGGEIDIECSVKNFKLADVITANIYIKLHVSYTPKGPQQPSIVPAGSHMDLSIHGKPVQIENLTQQFTDSDTLDKLRNRHSTDPKFRDWMHETCMVGRFSELQPHGLEDYFPFCRVTTGSPLENRYGATVPLFRATASGPGYKAFQNAITIDGFGRLQFGQLVITDSERYVTGLHIDLDGPVPHQPNFPIRDDQFDNGGGDGVTCASGGGGVGETTPP